MEIIGNVLDFIIHHGPTIVAVSSAICAITKTPDKGTCLSNAYKILDVLALNIGKAKDKPKDKSSF